MCMLLAPALPDDPRILLIGIAVAGLLAALIALVMRARRRGVPAVSELQVRVEEAPPRLAALDGQALRAAVKEAEAEGAVRRLPDLYLSLAQWRLDSGDTQEGEDLLRKCILGATSANLKDTHAKARVALGDIAQAAGDPVTACEHWQIARLLFHELRLSQDYDAVDKRMQRNGCPTDWVLTDF